jgi:3-methyladenine DNA glycosylase AlkD
VGQVPTIGEVQAIGELHAIEGMPTIGELTAAVSAALVAVADPDKAPVMQAYMKSAMPFLGVPKPVRDRALAPVFETHPLPDAVTWQAAVLGLWRGATYREQRYAAIALSGHRSYRGHQRTDALGMYDELVVSGAWWDYVDEIAARRVGPILAADPERVRPVIVRWSRDDDLWRRRVSIICQLGFGVSTDLELLYACIEPNLGDADFFIRKAIGWALRQYARTDPEEVRRYVAQHTSELSALSRREALRRIG